MMFSIYAVGKNLPSMHAHTIVKVHVKAVAIDGTIIVKLC